MATPFDTTKAQGSIRTSTETDALKNELTQLRESTFLSQNFTVNDYLFVVEGLEAPMVLLYVLLLPYGMGLVILYLFHAQQDLSNFLRFDIFTIVPIWAIGYEAIAAVMLTAIMFAALTFSKRKHQRIAKLEQTLQLRRGRNRHQKGDDLHYS
jgi:hypothetical protein